MAENIFNSVQLNKVDSNHFDLSYDYKLSLNMGDLIPIHCQEILPGDKIKMSSETLLRFAPLIAPVMHRVDVYQHFFFVPNRISWTGWEEFITGKAGVAHPYLEDFPVTKGSLADYLGLPTGIVDKANALPFAAYHRVYNEYFKDQNLSGDAFCDLRDGSQNVLDQNQLLLMRKRAWGHDYFTSALPTPQKGAAVTMPSATFSDVPVQYVPNMAPTSGLRNRNTGTALSASATDLYMQGDGVTDKGPIGIGTGMAPKLDYDPGNTLYAKTSLLQATAATINDFRKAIKLQEWLERAMRGGSRYIENTLSQFGVRSSDARLNRPEYLGGSKQPVVISEVLQTAPPTSDGPTAQGNMAGHGISVGGSKQFDYYAEEHGYIIGIMSVVPKTAYQQGIPKHFSKFDFLSYAWPSFANLGEQEIQNREIYFQYGDTQNNSVFGYTPRYAEYKYHDNRTAGDFKTSLSFWHLGRIFSNRPALNQSFIECDPRSDIFAVEDPDEHKLYCHIFHQIDAVRKLPKYGTPTL